MILPTITAVSREALAAVPKRLPAAAYGLGATPLGSDPARGLADGLQRYLRRVGVGLRARVGRDDGAGDAGRQRQYLRLVAVLPAAARWAALLANHFPEADKVEVGALMYAAVVLLLITLAVNALGSLIMLRTHARVEGLALMTAPASAEHAESAPTHLFRSLRNGRTALNTVLTVVAFALSAAAMLPLFSVCTCC